MRSGKIEGHFISVGHSGPMLKISWRSIKIWPRYEGLKLTCKIKKVVNGYKVWYGKGR